MQTNTPLDWAFQICPLALARPENWFEIGGHGTRLGLNEITSYTLYKLRYSYVPTSMRLIGRTSYYRPRLLADYSHHGI
jgi:hypothetical protein